MPGLTPPIRAAVLTVSDRCSRGEREDASGPALVALLRARPGEGGAGGRGGRGGLGAEVVATAIVPDDADAIAARLVEWSEPSLAIDLVVSTGGTGLAPRDHTPEAARRVFHREHPALMELARYRCLAKTPRAYLSRGVAGTIHRTLILTLPGSPRGAVENLEALMDILPHAIETLRGDVTDG
jgi:molybdenum cofactor synthesis domain-containing protein